MPAPASEAFTASYDHPQNKLIVEITVETEGKNTKGVSLWDTGATNTCISPKIVRELGLVVTGKTLMYGSTSARETNTYLVDLYLPNHVRVTDVRALEADLESQGIDVLVGMDIINLGDFAVSNYGGKTSFTFCIPSRKTIDFVKQIETEKLIGPKHGKGSRRRK